MKVSKKSVFTAVIIVLACAIIWFAGWSLYVSLNLYLMIAEANFRPILLLAMLAASVGIFYGVKRRGLFSAPKLTQSKSARVSEMPIMVERPVSTERQAPIERQASTEEILCEGPPQSVEEHALGQEKPTKKESVIYELSKQELEDQLEREKVLLKIAVYKRLAEDVESKKIDVEPALDILKDEGPRDTPAILRNKKEKQVVGNVGLQSVVDDGEEEKPLV